MAVRSSEVFGITPSHARLVFTGSVPEGEDFQKRAFWTVVDEVPCPHKVEAPGFRASSVLDFASDTRLLDERVQRVLEIRLDRAGCSETALAPPLRGAVNLA